MLTENIESLFRFVGTYPRVQKRWITLGSHLWVRWIGLTGALQRVSKLP